MSAKTYQTQPNEPLHMTTRAASLASSVAAGTTAPSAASNESRRSSLGEATKSVGGDDLDSDRPAKMAKISTQNSIAVSQQSTPPQDSNPISRTRAAALALNQNTAVDTADTADDEPQDGAISDGQASQLWDEDAMDEAEDSADENNHTQDTAKSNHNLRGLRGSANDSHNRNGRQSNGQNQTSNAQSNERQSVEAEESGGILKRMPGRRRAPHPDLSIEVDLRRQLELKVAYRAVVKALKPILAELAERTKSELQAKDDSHKQFDEYEQVISELDERLSQRRHLLQAELQAEEARLERDYEARKLLTNEKFDMLLRDRRDDYLLQCQNKCLNILHEAENEDDSDATDYEDGVVPKLYHIDKHGVRTVLSDGYDSRSRFYVETAKKWDDLAARCEFRQQQQNFDEASFVRKPKGFALFDPKQREIARAYFDVQQLADAAQHVEHEADRETRRAESRAATGLHALADATTMTSPISQDVKPNINHLRTPKAQNSSAGESKHETATSATKERSARRPRQISKPQPLFNAAPDPYNPSNPPAPDRQDASMQYAPPPALPPIYGHPAQPPPAGAVPGPDSAPPLNAWQQRVDYPDPRRDGFGVSAHQEPQAVEPAHAPTNNEFSRQNRRRRGPRAFFANDQQTNNPAQGHVQSAWEPFTNTMGPPTYLPPYVKPADQARAPNSPAESPISPILSGPGPSRSGSDWPGFSTNPIGGHGRVGGIDRQMPHGSSFPVSGGSPPSSASSRPALSVEQLSGRRAQTPPDSHRQGEQSPRNNQNASQQPYYPSSQSYSGYPPSNQYYGPYRPYSQAPSSSDRQSFSTPTSTSLPPLLPHPFHLNNPQYSPSQPQNPLSPRQLPGVPAQQDPSHDQANRQALPSNQSQIHQQPLPLSPYSRSQSYASQTPGGNQVPIQPQPQTQTPGPHYPGQPGHQRILPATLDPTRHGSANSQNPSPSMRHTTIAGSPPEADRRSSGPTPGSATGVPSRHDSPRASATSPSAPGSSTTHHYGFLPPFSGTGQSYRPPQRQTPTSLGVGNTPGRPLQPTPPHQQPRNETTGTPNSQSRPPQYGSSPYAAIAPAPAGPQHPLGIPSGNPQPPPSMSPHGHSHQPPPTPGSAGDMHGNRQYEQPQQPGTPSAPPADSAAARRDSQPRRNDKDKARAPPQKEWKWTNRYG